MVICCVWPVLFENTPGGHRPQPDNVTTACGVSFIFELFFALNKWLKFMCSTTALYLSIDGYEHALTIFVCIGLHFIIGQWFVHICEKHEGYGPCCSRQGAVLSHPRDTNNRWIIKGFSSIRFFSLVSFQINFANKSNLPLVYVTFVNSFCEIIRQTITLVNVWSSINWSENGKYIINFVNVRREGGSHAHDPHSVCILDIHCF